MNQFSIIIPVYNVEQYIEKCLDSVINQSFSDYEVIMVDDGSTDNSGDICEQYVRKDSRFKAIHKANEGLSMARNDGIKIAKGKYILFVDSDDWLLESALERAFALCENSHNADVILNRIAIYYDNQDQYEECPYWFDIKKLENMDSTSVFMYCNKNPQFLVSAYGFIVNREYLLKHNLYFIKGIFHEDAEWSPRLILNANKLAYNNQCLYCYRANRKGSIIDSLNIKKEYDKLSIIDLFMKEASKDRYNQKQKQGFLSRCSSLYFAVLGNVWLYRTDDKEKYDTLLIQLRKKKQVLLYSRKYYHFLAYVLIHTFGVSLIDRVISVLLGKGKSINYGDMGFMSMIKRGLKNLFSFLYRIKTDIRSGLSIFFILFPINKNKIVFSSYLGKGYGDNGKYIVEEILKQKLDYDIVWLLSKKCMVKNNIPHQVRVVKYGSLRGLYELATAKVWVDNCRKSFFSHKRKEQFYIQTWHGGLGIKKIEKDVENTLSKSYVRDAIRDSKMADLFISNSTHLTNIYKRAFWYSGEICECGYPKNDIFFGEREERDPVREYFNIDYPVKIVLYAPTFRANNNMSAYNVDFSLVLDVLQRKTNEKWVAMMRLHPNLLGVKENISLSSTVKNATNYPDMQELALACDVLVSDYSSCIFDFALQKKPTFLYVSDLENYNKDRGVYFNLEELPFPIATNNQQLVEAIGGFESRKYEKEVDAFIQKVGLKESGNGAKIIVERIKKVCK